MKLKILVVEDDKLFQKLIINRLSGHSVDIADNFKTASAKINSNTYDIAFFDLMLGKNDNHSGLKLIPLSVKKGIYSVVMSSSEAEEIINKAYELGCRDYYGKGNEDANINSVIDRYIKSLSQSGSDELFLNDFITRDPETINLINEAIRYAPTDIPIVILGDSGTGKTKLSSIIHEHSGRKGNFVAINCSSYTPELLEAELFGYKKGAFTGAYESRNGKLLEANGGTLFLDEIGAMSLDMQTKLLKAIEEKTFYPLGSGKAEYSNFRIISATLEDFQKLFEEGKLRFDFFQRIHGFTVKLKPISERRGDIFPLIKHFTRKGKKLSFDEKIKEFILNYSWPGNIREIKKFVDLASAGLKGKIDLNQTVKNDIVIDSDFITRNQYEYTLKHGLAPAIEKFTREIVLKNLSENGEIKTKTISKLKISTRLLYSVLKGSKK